MNDIIEKSKKIFGITKKCSIPSFILPDGKILDIVGKTSLHREYHPHDPAAIKVLGNVKKPTDVFLEKTGSVRYFPQPRNLNVEFNVNHPFTKKQYETLEECACFGKVQKHLVYDFIDDGEIVRSSGTYDTDDCFERVKKIKMELLRVQNER